MTSMMNELRKQEKRPYIQEHKLLQLCNLLSRISDVQLCAQLYILIRPYISWKMIHAVPGIMMHRRLLPGYPELHTVVKGHNDSDNLHGLSLDHLPALKRVWAASKFTTKLTYTDQCVDKWAWIQRVANAEKRIQVNSSNRQIVRAAAINCTGLGIMRLQKPSAVAQLTQNNKAKRQKTTSS